MGARFLGAMLLVLVTPWAATAAPKEKPQGPNKAKSAVQRRDGSQLQVSIVFSERDRQTITGWTRDRRSGLPPGLAKKEQLPPGLQKQLVRNGTLPPGLDKKAHPLPDELERMLAPMPPDYVRVAINGSFVIVNRRTRIIADVFANLVP